MSLATLLRRQNWSSIASWLVFLLIAARLFLLFPVTRYDLTAEGFDLNWIFGLNFLSSADVIFGRDLVYSYGPLGFLFYPMRLAGRYLIAQFFWAFIAFVFGFCVVLMKKSLTPAKFSGFGLLLFMFMDQLGAVNEEYLIVPLVFLILLQPFFNRPFLSFSAVLGFFLSGLFLFCKFNLGLTTVVSAPLVAVFWKSSLPQITPRYFILGAGALALSITMGILLLFQGNVQWFCQWMHDCALFASAYSDSMTFPADHYLSIALTLIVGLLFAAAVLIRKNRQLAWLLLAMMPALMVTFKHSFTRADPGHEHNMFTMLAADAAILFLFSKSRLANLILFAVALSSWLAFQSTCTKPLCLQLIEQRRAYYLSLGAKPRPPVMSNEGVKLPPAIEQAVPQGSTVDSLPFKIAYCSNPKWRYRPNPLLELATACSSGLDKLCAEHFRNDGPDYLIVRFEDIDRRNMLWDLPLTWRTIRRNYILAAEDPVEQVGLLKRLKSEARPSNQGSKTPTIDETSANTQTHTEHQAPTQDQAYRGRRADLKEQSNVIQTNKWCSVPDLSQRLCAELRFRPRFKYFVEKLFYQAPISYLDLHYRSGAYRRFRLVTDSARNGILINFVPINFNDFVDMFSNHAYDKVDAYRLSGAAMKSFQDEVPVRYFVDGASVRLDEPDAEKPKYYPVDVSKAQGNIDAVAGSECRRLVTVSRRSELVRVEGWAANIVAHEPSSDILFCAGNSLIGRASCDAPYPGVSKLLGIDGCGFSADINVESLPIGTQELKLFVGTGQSKYFPAPFGARLNIVP
jgi:hypothetical protein